MFICSAITEQDYYSKNHNSKNIEAMFDNAEEGICVMDTVGKITFINKKMARMIG